MWVRKRLDIGWSDAAYGCLRSVWPARRPLADADLAAGWMPRGEALVCLSVRSGFDLLLSALALPRGSEVVVSAINIPDIGHIVERQGHSVVPVDIDPDTYHPSAESVIRAISSRTRLIVIAHLFGGHADVDTIVDLAGREGILVVEDCAQAFAGRRYTGHARSDAALFSFGPIKTATALAGAVVRVSNPQVLDRMRKLQQTYPQQSRVRYLGRLVKYSMLKFLASGPVYGAAVRAVRTVGADHDRLLHGRLRSFEGSGDLLSTLRRQPCEPLKHLLRRRIARFDEGRLSARQANGQRLANHLARRGLSPAVRPEGTFWVFPYAAHDPKGLAEWLLANGFDVVRRSSLVALQPTSRDRPAPANADRVMQSLVFLPAYPEMPEREIDRLAQLIAEFETRTAEKPSAATGSAA